MAALGSKTGHASFLLNIMKQFKRKFELTSSAGTTFGSLDKDELHGLPVIIPPEHVLNEFEEKVGSFVELQKNLATETIELIKLRDWLLPMLINGQLTLRE